MEFASILSAEYADQLLKAGKAADINQKPVGTGPFIFRSYTKDATIRFDGNPDYWKPNEVKIVEADLLDHADPAVRVQKLKRDECQVMSYPRPADIAALKAESNVAMPSQAGFNLGYIAYNMTHKPLDNVRRASARSTWRSTRKRSSIRCTRAPARPRPTRCRRRNGPMTRT